MQYGKSSDFDKIDHAGASWCGADQLARFLDGWVARSRSFRSRLELVHMGYSAFELREILRAEPGSADLTISRGLPGTQVIHFGGRDYIVPDEANADQIRDEIRKAAALVVPRTDPFSDRRVTSAAVTGYQPGMIKAALDVFKQRAMQRRQAAIARIDAADLKHQAVDQELERLADEIKKEADNALQEFATFTNGSPKE